MASRSARRQTVRATWSWAAPGAPPGNRKLVSGPTTALNSSMSRSSFSMWRGSTVGTGWRAWLVGRRGEVRAEVEQLVLDRRQLGRQPLAQPRRERHPDLRVELVDRAVRCHPLANPWAPAGRRPARSSPRRRSSCRSSSGVACGHCPAAAGRTVALPVDLVRGFVLPSVGHRWKTSRHNVVFGGTSAARAGREAGDHHRVCHQGR